MNNAIKITPRLGENHGMFRSSNYFQAILANLFVLGTLFDFLLPCVWWFLNLFSWYNVGGDPLPSFMNWGKRRTHTLSG